MITRDNLKSIGFNSINNSTYYDAPNWEYEFDIHTQELWNINDGAGEPTFLCKVTDFEKLKELIELKV